MSSRRMAVLGFVLLAAAVSGAVIGVRLAGGGVSIGVTLPAVWLAAVGLAARVYRAKRLARQKALDDPHALGDPGCDLS